MSNLSRIFIAIILSFAFSIDYLEEIQPIFNASCISCHNSDSQNYSNHQLDLTSYSGLMNGGESGDVITPYDASSSILYQEVSSGNMPQYGSGEFLVVEQINLIADWINDGALEEEDENELEDECLDSNDCEDGLFCNMDHTSDEEVTAGSCEPCDYYSAIEDCYTDGLPEAGEAECADVCFDDGGALDNDLTIQDTYKISSIYPNPFNPTTTVTYQIPEFSTISIDIYNMNGQLVQNLYRGYKSPGEYSIEWTAGNITSGAYLIKLVSGSFVETQKVMLVK